MRALTLWRPWCWAIVIGAKPIENRGWKPFESVLCKRIAIHAGVAWDKQGARSIDQQLILDDDIRRVPDPLKWPGGAIVGTVRVQGWLTESDRCGITADEAEQLRASPWYSGAVGWVLRDPVRLREPVPCRGMQGLWEVPRNIAARVLELGGAAP